MTRNLARIAEGLSIIFPDLGYISSLQRLGDGFRSLIVETPDGLVFKIAKTWEASAGFAKELQLLPRIHDLLPLPTPYPVWHDGSSAHFPIECSHAC